MLLRQYNAISDLSRCPARTVLGEVDCSAESRNRALTIINAATTKTETPLGGYLLCNSLQPLSLSRARYKINVQVHSGASR